MDQPLLRSKKRNGARMFLTMLALLVVGALAFFAFRTHEASPVNLAENAVSITEVAEEFGVAEDAEETTAEPEESSETTEAAEESSETTSEAEGEDTTETTGAAEESSETTSAAEESSETTSAAEESSETTSAAAEESSETTSAAAEESEDTTEAASESESDEESTETTEAASEEESEESTETTEAASEEESEETTEEPKKNEKGDAQSDAELTPPVVAAPKCGQEDKATIDKCVALPEVDCVLDEKCKWNKSPCNDNPMGIQCTPLTSERCIQFMNQKEVDMEFQTDGSCPKCDSSLALSTMAVLLVAMLWF